MDDPDEPLNVPLWLEVVLWIVGGAAVVGLVLLAVFGSRNGG